MSDTLDKPVTSITVEWNFSVPNHSGKCLLLTTGGICVTGDWYGELGQYFAAYAALPKYDHAKFNQVLQDYRDRITLSSTQATEGILH